MRKNIDIFENLTQVAEYHRTTWPTLSRNMHSDSWLMYSIVARLAAE